MNNNAFLRLLAYSLAEKMKAVTEIDAIPISLDDRVLSYMKYKCQSGILKGIEQTAFRLHCSARQLQRIMNKYENAETVIKIGKGTYKLTEK